MNELKIEVKYCETKAKLPYLIGRIRGGDIERMSFLTSHHAPGTQVTILSNPIRVQCNLKHDVHKVSQLDCPIMDTPYAHDFLSINPKFSLQQKFRYIYFYFQTPVCSIVMHVVITVV